jgi:glycosyltransferase involved in cell wall biosynthesis
MGSGIISHDHKYFRRLLAFIKHAYNSHAVILSFHYYLMSHNLPKQPSGEGRVLILSGVKGDTRRYRCFHLYEQLQLAGLPVLLSHQMDPNLIEKAGQAEVVVIHRAAFDSKLARFFEIIQKKDGVLIQDVDDLIFDPKAMEWIDSPDFQDPIRARLYRDDLRRNRETLDRCSVVTASTEYLAGCVRNLEKPAWVHRNGFSLEMLALSEAALKRRRQEKTGPSEKVVIGYASGTPTHNKDFAMIREGIVDILRKYNQVELHLIGPLDTGSSWGDLSVRVRHTPLVPWRELPGLLASFDINLAPLVQTNPFSHSKSEIKYMEAAMVQVPTIASATDAFSYAIRSGENGWLVNSEDEWRQVLDYLIENPQERRLIGQNAYQDVLKKYTPIERAGQFLHTLNDIYIHLKGKPFCEIMPDINEFSNRTHHYTSIPSSFEREPTILNMGIYNLRQRGVGTMAGRVWVFFRRLFIPLFPFKT